MAYPQQIRDWHDQLLDLMLAQRVKDPTFTFAPRQKNNDHRLEHGYWFQGNEYYVFGGMTLENDENNKTRQVGFVVGTDRDGKTRYNAEIVFKTTRNVLLRQVLKDFVTRNDSGFEHLEKPNTVFDGFRYKKYYPETLTMEEAFQVFIEQDWRVLLDLAQSKGVLNGLVMPEPEFIHYLGRILFYRTRKEVSNLDLQETAPPKNLNFANPVRKFAGAIIDFKKEQEENEQLGWYGEQFVIDFEKKRLKEAGFPLIADKVGKVLDGKGYDILSFDTSDNEIHIEIKTTRYGIETPFYISEHEVAYSVQHAKSYVLWRLYESDTARGIAKYYRLYGNMREVLQLKSVSYCAIPV